MTVNVTFLLTLSMTEIDHCKRYDEVEYDRKQAIVFLQWFEIIFGHTHGRRNVYSCHIWSILKQ